MRKLLAGIITVALTAGLSTTAQASPLSINYLATADCGTLKTTLTSLNLVVGPTTKSQLAEKVKVSSIDVLAGLGMTGADAQMLASKTAVDVSNRALECGIVSEDPKVMGSIEIPTQLADLKIMLSN
ncbi:hypothetical protein [Corynebacterium sp. H130]|uniref:hypothetical protein n=1 Tax=Corynebacterium sp. H130 TaxID=3133444 RepID=UPI0030A5D7B3